VGAHAGATVQDLRAHQLQGLRVHLRQGLRQLAVRACARRARMHAGACAAQCTPCCMHVHNDASRAEQCSSAYCALYDALHACGQSKHGCALQMRAPLSAMSRHRNLLFACASYPQLRTVADHAPASSSSVLAESGPSASPLPPPPLPPPPPLLPFCASNALRTKGGTKPERTLLPVICRSIVQPVLVCAHCWMSQQPVSLHKFQHRNAHLPAQIGPCRALRPHSTPAWCRQYQARLQQAHT